MKPLKKIILLISVWGTGGLQNPAKLDSSSYDPLPFFNHFYSLPFCLTWFFNEKYMYFSWVPGGYC
jgi:hypothetical protein